MLKTSFAGENMVLGGWTPQVLQDVLDEACRIKDEGERIAFTSSKFIGTLYKEKTLIGGPSKAEVFTVNLKEVDCFTFLDYVEALRLSIDLQGLIENIKKVRYCSGVVSYKSRNHFFTDWPMSGRVCDVTAIIGNSRVLRIEKTLNRKDDGTLFIDNIIPVKRTLYYIPAGAIDSTVTGLLESGDYAGIYSDLKGLDVSHVGIVVRAEDKVILRHASSAAGKVVEEDFMTYIKDKPGLIVLRASDKMTRSLNQTGHGM